MDQTTATNILPSIIMGGFSLLMLVIQWSLKRNLDHQDERAKKQDERSDKIERNIEHGLESLRSEISAMSHNIQATSSRFDMKSAVMERDLGQLQGTFSKLEARVDRLAEHWRAEHDKLDERVASRIEKAMTDVLDTIDELKKEKR